MDVGPISEELDDGQDPRERAWKYARTLVSPKWDRRLFIFPLTHVRGMRPDGTLVCSCKAGWRCPSPGKHPVFTDWQVAASTERDTIDRWWRAREPFGEYRGANIGLSCERSGVLVLDADRHNPQEDGLDTIRQLEAIIGPLPITWLIQTGGGGWQYYFDLCLAPDEPYPSFIKSLDQLGIGPAVDVQGRGKLVVAPGSATRKLYRFLGGEDGLDPYAKDTPEHYRRRPERCPDVLRELLLRPAVPPRGTGTGPAADTLLGHLAAAANLVRANLRGDKLAIYCPWSRATGYPDGHDEGTESSTIIMPACEGSRLGGFNCFHRKCTDRTGDDFRKLFTDAERWPDAPAWLEVADRALDEQGVQPVSRRSQRRPDPEASPKEEPVDADDMGPNVPDVHRLLATAGVRFTVSGPKEKRVFHVDCSPANLADFFRFHPAFTGAFRLDTASMRIVCSRVLAGLPPPLSWPAAGEPFEPHHMTVLARYLEHPPWNSKNLQLGKTSPLPIALNAVAAEHAFNPITEWLRSFPTWDGTDRLATWVETVLGVEDAVSGRMGYRWMLQAIARALSPGCKADAILILEGPQGIGKNRLIDAMNEPHPTIQLSISLERGDEVPRRCRTGFIVELPELSALRGASVERIKEFISATHDSLRTFYTERVASYARSFSFIGTTNLRSYLTDHSGNRRFLCIRCPGPINVEAFRAIRDQLYAECIARHDQGEAHWFTADEAVAFEEHATERVSTHPWQDDIADWLTSHPDCRALRSNDILEHIVKVTKDRKAPNHYPVIAAAMTSLGWREHKHIGQNGRSDRGVRGYYLPHPDDLDLGPPDAYDFAAHASSGFHGREW